MTVAEIKSRLVKLEAMTEPRGASRQEAAMARRLATELRAKLPPEFNRQFAREDVTAHHVDPGESRGRRSWRKWEEAQERQQSYTEWFHQQMRPHRDDLFDTLKRDIKERTGVLKARRHG